MWGCQGCPAGPSPGSLRRQQQQQQQQQQLQEMKTQTMTAKTLHNTGCMHAVLWHTCIAAYLWPVLQGQHCCLLYSLEQMLTSLPTVLLLPSKLR
jgi:hypothetical protein